MSDGLNHKINVAFMFKDINEWTGGLNYFKNLFSALKINNNFRINPVLVLNKSDDNSKIKKYYSDLAQIIEPEVLFKDKSLLNKLNRKTLKLFKKSFFYDAYFKFHNINVVSHSNFCNSTSDLKKINWIPDFQHIHLPEMFSDSEIQVRGNHYKLLAEHSDIIILSSYDALEDYKRFSPDYAYKGRVLHFVSIPNAKVYEKNNSIKEQIYSKYNLGSKFFYMPNQFWKHKNHKVVFEAVNRLKKLDLNVQVVFTGHLNDYRNNEHITELQDYIKQNKLEDNIKILGLIEYEEVLFLMRNCISLINPSLFEGWNTMVEEAKSIGKNIILSNLNVHREQAPPEGIFFDPKNSEQLAEILKDKWQNSLGGPDYELEVKAKASLNSRIFEFAETYQNYVKEVLAK